MDVDLDLDVDDCHGESFCARALSNVLYEFDMLIESSEGSS